MRRGRKKQERGSQNLSKILYTSVQIPAKTSEGAVGGSVCNYQSAISFVTLRERTNYNAEGKDHL